MVFTCSLKYTVASDIKPKLQHINLLNQPLLTKTESFSIRSSKIQNGAFWLVLYFWILDLKLTISNLCNIIIFYLHAIYQNLTHQIHFLSLHNCSTHSKATRLLDAWRCLIEVVYLFRHGYVAALFRAYILGFNWSEGILSPPHQTRLTQLTQLPPMRNQKISRKSIKMWKFTNGPHFLVQHLPSWLL